MTSEPRIYTFKVSLPNTKKEVEEQLELMFEPVTPIDLDDAIRFLDTVENQNFVRGYCDETRFSIDCHRGASRSMRNDWGFWTGSVLQRWFKSKGIHHADDMSAIISVSYFRHVHGKPIDLEGQIKHYQAHWEEWDPNVNKGIL